MLQIRTRVLNEDWEDTFRGWYPGCRPKLENEIKQRLDPWILMLSVLTVAIHSTSTTAERGIEMFNIAAAAATLAELGRRIRRARTKLHWSQEAFAGVCGLERS